MSRLVVFLIVLLVVIGGVLFLLAGRDSERPAAQVEKQVSLANLQ
ncbi:hypothetical protein [Sphingomonas sp. 1P08PE]